MLNELGYPPSFESFICSLGAKWELEEVAKCVLAPYCACGFVSHHGRCSSWHQLHHTAFPLGGNWTAVLIDTVSREQMKTKHVCACWRHQWWLGIVLQAGRSSLIFFILISGCILTIIWIQVSIMLHYS